MDWRMPGINGIEAARQIQDRSDLNHVPAILDDDGVLIARR